MPVPEGYVEVSERIQRFYEAYPEGSLVEWRQPWMMHIGERSFVCYSAAAYRTPDDPRPGIGTAWEPVPGPTPFTRDSELQNAETSAWGRAIAALGFEIRRGIATVEDVSARVDEQQPQPEPTDQNSKLSEKQNAKIAVLLKQLEEKYPTQEGQKSWVAKSRQVAGVKSRADLTVAAARSLIEWLIARLDDPDDFPF